MDNPGVRFLFVVVVFIGLFLGTRAALDYNDRAKQRLVPQVEAKAPRLAGAVLNFSPTVAPSVAVDDFQKSTLARLEELGQIAATRRAETIQKARGIDALLLHGDPTPSLRLQLTAHRRQLAQEEIEDLAKTKESFYSVESTAKERNNGALPDWVKDDRRWQYLDSVFTTRK